MPEPFSPEAEREYHPPGSPPKAPEAPGAPEDFNLEDFKEFLGETTPRDEMIRQAQSIYFRIWGVFPPEGYIEKLVDAGYNIFEIEDMERAKPAFANSKAYSEDESHYVRMLAQIFGTGRL